MSTWLQVFTAYPGVWSEKSYSRFRPQQYTKSNPSECKTFWKELPPNKKKAFVPFKCDKRWAKLKVNSKEYIACVDPKHFAAGNLYNDDSRSIIYLKLALINLARPFHILIKVISHLTAGWIIAIAKGVKKGESAKKITERVIRNFADIVRTLVYGIALLIIGIAAVLISPCKPTLLYDFRALIGRLAHELYWGSRKGLDMHPCMRRELNIVDWAKNRRMIEEKRFQYKDIMLAPEALEKSKEAFADTKEKEKYESQINSAEAVYRKWLQEYHEMRVKSPLGDATIDANGMLYQTKLLLPMNQKEAAQAEESFKIHAFQRAGATLPDSLKSYVFDKCLKAPEVQYRMQDHKICRIKNGETTVYNFGEMLGEGEGAQVLKLIPENPNKKAKAVKRYKTGIDPLQQNNEKKIFFSDKKWPQKLTGVEVPKAFLNYGDEAMMVMSLCQGTLKEKVAGMTEKEQIAAIDQLIQGVAEIHSRGVVHGEINFPNILIKEKKGETHYRLADFGWGGSSDNTPARADLVGLRGVIRAIILKNPEIDHMAGPINEDNVSQKLKEFNNSLDSSDSIAQIQEKWKKLKLV
jgi:tRNA A-37 threonylcarbamoyl transferase component Bud32